MMRSMKSDFQVLFPSAQRHGEAWEVFLLSFDQNPSKALLHWVTTRYKAPCFLGLGLKIISFDIAKETFREIPLPSCGSLDICNYQLVVLVQCLSVAVCCSDGSTEIWMMKGYNAKESYIKNHVIRAYIPTSLNQTAAHPTYARPWKKSTESKGTVQVVCTLKNGDILLQYTNGALVLYNPASEEFKDLAVSGFPKWFCTTVRVEGLS